MALKATKSPCTTQSQSINSTLILLVEDEPVVRDVTRVVLEHAGYYVLESSNAKEALRLAQEHQGEIRLLLTDVVMPEMNGPDLAQQLLQQQPDLITVFMSGYARSDVAQKIAQRSAIHLQKPFTIDTLLSRIAQALERSSAAPVYPVLPGSGEAAAVEG